MDWRAVDENPVAPEVRAHLKVELNNKLRPLHRPYISELMELCAGRDVLDIGAVQHHAEFYDAPEWIHGKIASVAKRAVGVDVAEAGVADLVKRGYDLRLMDATAGEFLQEFFDLVVAGDVIEHVGSPQALLEFCRRHVRDSGLVVVKTPSPFYWRRLWSYIRDVRTIVNAEHVSWITPTMALELGLRSELKLETVWLVSGSPSRAGSRLVHSIAERLGVAQGLFTWDFVYVYQVASDSQRNR